MSYKLPDGWKKEYIKNLGTLARGKSKHRPRYDEILYDGAYPFIQTGEIKAANKYITKFEKTYSEKGLEQSKLWEKGTLCITIAANIAEIAILSFDACFPDSVLGFQSYSDKCTIDFIYYLLFYYKQDIKKMSYGSVQENINLATFDRISFNIPPLQEQKAIASTLSCLDDKIELNNKMNETLEAMAQALFKRWFIDFEFPDENGNPYKSSGGKMIESEMGLIPDGWEVSTLTETANYLNGLAMQKYKPLPNENNTLPVIKIRELNQGNPDINSNKCSINIPDEYKINNGDIIFSWSGTLKIVIWFGGEGGLNQHLFKISSNKFDKWFYYLWTKFYLNEFIQIAKDKATTMGHIQRKHLDNSKVLIPNIEQYNNINKIITPILEQLINNGKEIQKLEATRNTLLPKLMSGELRVPYKKED